MWEEELVFISLWPGVHQAWLTREQKWERKSHSWRALLSAANSVKVEDSRRVGEVP